MSLSALYNSIYFFSPFLVVFFLFSFGWISTFYFRNQFLISLLSLELILLSLFLGLIFTFGSISKPVSLSFYLLVLGACEASLGLSLLVNVVRLGGSDILSLVNSINC